MRITVTGLSFALAVALQAAPVNLQKVTVSASEEETTKAADIETLQLTRQMDVAEMLNSVYPELATQRKSGMGGEVILRGFRNDDINVLIDGNRIHGACPNRMDPPAMHVSTNEIASIEVTEGPYDVTNFGGMGGTVNVKSRNPEKGFSGEISAKAGSFGYQNLSLYVTGGNELLQAIVGYQQQSMDIYEDGAGTLVVKEGGGAGTYKYTKAAEGEKLFDVANTWTKIQVTPTENLRFRVGYGFDDNKQTLYPGKSMDSVKDETTRYSVEAEVDQLGSFSDRVAVRYYGSSVEHDMDNYTFRSNTMNKMIGQAESSTGGIKLSNRTTVGDGVLEVGLEQFERTWENTQIKNGSTLNYMLDAKTEATGVYATLNLPVSAVEMEIGGRVDQAESSSELPNGSASMMTPPMGASAGLAKAWGATYDKDRTDTLSALYVKTVLPLDNGRAYVGIGQSSRLPDPEELYTNLPVMGTNPGWVGNPELEPATNRQLDAGVRFHPLEGFMVDFNGFFSDVSDYITQISMTGADTKRYKSWDNIDARIYGGDLTLGYAVTRALAVKLAAAYQVGKKKTKAVGQTDSDLADIPPMKTMVQVNYKKGAFFASVEGVHYAEQTKYDSDTEQASPDAASVLNVKAGYQWNETLGLSLGVDNLTDKEYALYHSYDRNPLNPSSGVIISEPGRFVYANLNYRF